MMNPMYRTWFREQMTELAVRAVLGAAVLGVLSTLLRAQPEETGEGRERRGADSPWLTVQRIFDSDEFRTEGSGVGDWLLDGSGYTAWEDSETLDGGRDLVRYDTETGERTIWVRAEALLADGAERPLRPDGHAWSSDYRKLLLYTNAQRVWRRNTRGDYWVWDLDRGELLRVGGQAEPARLMFATFSPRGDQVAYVYHHDLYVQRLRHGRTSWSTARRIG